MAVTREEIVATALVLLDEAGLAGLTLRRLAERLGIRAPTLYWYVRDKRELLDLLASAIMDNALAERREPQPGQPWWDWLAQRARSQRSALLAHRDGALVVSGNRPTPQALPGIERQLQALGDAGFPPPEALLALLTLNAYVIGEALDAQREAERATDRAVSTGAPQSAPSAQAAPEIKPQLLADGPYPLLLAAAGVLRSPDTRFEHGLHIMITGLRGRLDQVTSHPPARPHASEDAGEHLHP
jgi:TetR/AcrR family transcriptional regulator, tetracycline repressor protein